MLSTERGWIHRPVGPALRCQGPQSRLLRLSSAPRCGRRGPLLPPLRQRGKRRLCPPRGFLPSRPPPCLKGQGPLIPSVGQLPDPSNSPMDFLHERENRLLQALYLCLDVEGVEVENDSLRAVGEQFLDSHRQFFRWTVNRHLPFNLEGTSPLDGVHLALPENSALFNGLLGIRVDVAAENEGDAD